MTTEQTLQDTLTHLTRRLERLEVLLLPPTSTSITYTDPSKSADSDTIAVTRQKERPNTRDGGDISTRIARVEGAVRRIAARSEGEAWVLKMAAQHPSIFSTTKSSAPTPSSSTPPSDPEPTTPQKLSILTSEAPQITTTASQLRHLSDMPIPASSTFTKLINLRPRMVAAAQRQEEQAITIRELRERSAGLVMRWHEGMVLGQGRCLADWEGRVRGVEVGVRREERKREVEDG